MALPALFLLLHSAGPAPGGASLAALAYPSHLRALGSGVTNTAGSTGAAIGLFCYPLLQSALGAGGAIAVTAVVPLIGFITSTVITWDPETDGFGCDADADSDDSGGQSAVPALTLLEPFTGLNKGQSANPARDTLGSGNNCEYLVRYDRVPQFFEGPLKDTVEHRGDLHQHGLL